MARKTSPVRKNLIELLYIGGKMTAYDAYKHYIQIFAKTSQRNVYYQLEAGEAKGEFSVETKEESGDYGWGKTAIKNYYTVGKSASPTINPEVKAYFEKINKA